MGPLHLILGKLAPPLLAVLMIGGCGQKGPLFLSTDAPPPAQTNRPNDRGTPDVSPPDGSPLGETDLSDNES